MVAPLALAALQVQTGQVAEELTIAVHVAGLNLPDALMMRATTAAVLQGHGVSRAPIAGALPSVSLAPYHLTYPYPYFSGHVLVPEQRWFKAKNVLE
jgi:hypothetical protein